MIINIYRYILITLLFVQQNFTQALHWQKLYAPAASSLTSVIQLSNNDFYLVTKTYGIFRSTNNGNSWTEFNNGLLELYINEIYATNDNTLFVCGASGIYQFNWETEIWQDMNAPQADYTCIIANSLGYIVAGSNTGIYKSEDNGNTWKPATSYLGSVNSIALTSNNFLLAGTASGIYKSTDNGSVWTESGLQGLSIPHIYMDNTGVIYANVFYRGQGIYYSRDEGSNWHQLNSGLNDQLVSSFALDNSGNVYAGTTEGGIFQKSLIQSSFTQINLHQPMSNVLKIYSANDESIIICSEFGGILKKEINSQDWKQLNSGLPLGHAYPLGFDKSGYFYFGNFDSGIFRTTNNGNSWFPIAPYLGGSHHFSFLANNDQILLGTTIEIAFVGVLLRSVDKGESWKSFMDGIPPISPDLPYTQVVMDMDKNSHGDLFAALNTAGIYRRLSTENSWHFINSNTPDTNISSVCVNSNDIVFAGYRNGYICKSDDNGDSWAESLSGYKDYTIEYLNSVDDYVFAILHNSNYPYHTKSIGLYSFDDGESWNDLNLGILNSRVNSLAIYNGILVAGTDSNGVFASYDFGNNWVGSDTGLPKNTIYNIVCTPDGLLFCGTEKEGIYVADLKEVTSLEETKIEPSNYSLVQNYPNPFNPTTTIKYELPQESYVIIKLYDTLGQEVKNLVDSNKAAGIYTFIFDSTNLASGIYFYRMQAGNYIQTKKMIILK